MATSTRRVSVHADDPDLAQRVKRWSRTLGYATDDSRAPSEPSHGTILDRDQPGLTGRDVLRIEPPSTAPNGTLYLTAPIYSNDEKRWVAKAYWLNDSAGISAGLEHLVNSTSSLLARGTLPSEADDSHRPLWTFLKQLPPTPTPRARSIKAFISYRRADNAYAAGRIHAELSHRFGDRNVFLDVDSIPLGSDFAEVIRNYIADAQCLLVVIGPNWQPERLADANDFVRLELLEAHTQGKVIIPVVLEGAHPPSADMLPPELGWFARSNAAGLRSDAGFAADLDRIRRAIETL